MTASRRPGCFCSTSRRSVARIVQDFVRSIVGINRDEKASVLLLEQNSRMALRISGSIASADLAKDRRVRKAYHGGDI
jgi:branched-chain amino acid transport system ATP-binding protein